MTILHQGKTALRNMVKSLFWTLYGSTIRNPELPKDVRSILFVCKGNICRSPFAEHFAKNIFEKYSDGVAHYRISSVGIRAGKPETSPTEAIASAKQYDVDLCEHKSRPITYDLMESYDMIIAMEASQYNHLKKLFLEFEEKIYLLPLFCIDTAVSMNSYHKYNIQDPYGRTSEDFMRCFDRIGKCISTLHSIIITK